MPADAELIPVLADDESSDFEAQKVAFQQERASNRRRTVCYSLSAAAFFLGAAAVYAGTGTSGDANSDNAPLRNLDEDTEVVIVPPHDHCSKVSEDCSSTKCCKVSGYKCYSQSYGRASCLRGCLPGRDGWCTELVHTKPFSHAGTRLFCFAFYTEEQGSPKTKSYELALLREQLYHGANLFACPKWAVYSDVETWLSPGPPVLKTTQIHDIDGDFHLFKREKTGVWVNAMMFYQAWMDIRRKGVTADVDWVVKVDADTVFLADRLTHMLQGYRVPEGGVYIENCPKVMYGFFGNLEVVSQTGFETFLSGLEDCKATLDWKGLSPDWKWGPWGEDLFMQRCMDKIGVSKVSNFSITADGACKADLPKALQKIKGLKWHPDCADGKSISYHPFKKPDEYEKCWRKTQVTFENVAWRRELLAPIRTP